MNKLMEKLQGFLPVRAYDQVSEDEDEIFDIYDTSTDEVIGSYSLNEKGELVSYSLVDDAPEGTLKKEELTEIAKKFVDTFFPGQQEYEFSGILDLDNPYMVTYEKRDEKYGLFIHSTGFSITISTSGQIMSFYSTDEDYEILYSDIVVSEEKALETYIEGLDLELNIQQFDHEVYKNGDNNYHLSYSVIEQIMEIPVDGSDSPSIREEYPTDLTIVKRESPVQDVYELVSLTTDYTLLDKQVEGGKLVEVWSKQDSVDSYSFDMEEESNHVIRFCFDEKTGCLLHVKNGEEHDNSGEEIGLENAQERAMSLLFKQFPDAHERFRIEVFETENDEFEDVFEEDIEGFEGEEIELEEDLNEAEMFDEEFEDWEEEYIEVEETYTFYVHLFHQGLRVNNHVTVIQVGRYTGKITHFNLDVPSLKIYSNLSIKPDISVDEAKDIYKKHLKMERMFIREYDEDGKSIYTLAYVADFPDTVGHVRAIDATSGEAMYVDVGDATFIK
ncbi:YcdB/YcdC domain-containing protein [Fredinandcohnia onubensis]|uniref:YcdB/YcdC domain-containing protein n=1 Tax=Fredinandcohnia onubensis TaxID=1571209 RepID=UPI000C0BD555|nr:YcdB/YcdC domain-containing protein [Fredinandcohnia onubensis]